MCRGRYRMALAMDLSGNAPDSSWGINPGTDFGRPKSDRAPRLALLQPAAMPARKSYSRA